ncbi:phage major capsid protein [Sinorhizobium fredii]|uniref:phage major capsid protein n=1 Tax=Rhizobium fredii TaxID=380 RepID=UPI003518C502
MGIELAKLEKIEREVGDLRGMLVGIERSFRKGAKAERPAGTKFIAAAAASIFGHLKRHDLAAEWETKAAVSPAMTTVPTWAAELTTSTTADFVISLGNAVFAFPQIAARAHAFPLSANTRAIIGGTAVAAFVGEGEPIGVAAGTVSGAMLKPYAVKVLSTFSEDLAERSQPAVEALLRKILGDAVAACLDETFFGNQPATPRAPAGILNGLTPLTAGASFGEDVQALAAAIAPAADPVFVISPARRVGLAAAGDLVGFGDYPVYGSSALDDATMVALDAAGLAIGFGGAPSFAVSREATLVERTQDEVGPAVTTEPTRSLWQTDSASLKAALPVSWYMRAGGAAYTEAA